MNKDLLLAWIISLIATLGSLFFSEFMHFLPCNFCWYQRILMYPLSLILGIAFYYNEQLIYKYVLPFSIVGIMVSGYHYCLQKVPFLKQFETCKSGIPCSGQYINWFGFITIPFLALIAFILITAMMIKIKKGFNL